MKLKYLFVNVITVIVAVGMAILCYQAFIAPCDLIFN